MHTKLVYECFGKLGIVLIFGLPTNIRQSMVRIHSNSCLMLVYHNPHPSCVRVCYTA